MDLYDEDEGSAISFRSYLGYMNLRPSPTAKKFLGYDHLDESFASGYYLELVTTPITNAYNYFKILGLGERLSTDLEIVGELKFRQKGGNNPGEDEWEEAILEKPTDVIFLQRALWEMREEVVIKPL